MDTKSVKTKMNSKNKRSLALLVVVGAVLAGCELAVDFDRSLIDAGSVDASFVDVQNDTSPPVDSGGKDTSPPVDSGGMDTSMPDTGTDTGVDSGTDAADADMGDAADASD